MTLLQDKVAIITGSGRGIGASAALNFAEQGAKVVVTDLDPEPAQATAEQIKQAGGEALALVGDVTKEADIDAMVKETIARFGQIDVLVNNAGYTWDGMLHKMSDDQWDAMLAIHLTAPFKIIRATVPHMREAAKQEIAANGVARARKIINISSTTGTRGAVGQVNYSAAKSGVLGLTKTLAKEWGPFNIQVNAVAFGYIDTRLTRPKEQQGERMERGESAIDLGIPEKVRDGLISAIPMGRPGTVAEAAGPLIFFASDLSNYISGQVLEISGGW